MTPDQVARIRDDFRRVGADADGFAAAFYRRLFHDDPAVTPLFARVDMAAQRTKLVAALAFVVQGLDRPTAMIPAVSALARRHVGYGVVDEHYAAVGAALLATLAERLGPTFDDEARAAWAAAYEMLSLVMIAAARDEACAA